MNKDTNPSQYSELTNHEKRIHNLKEISALFKKLAYEVIQRPEGQKLSGDWSDVHFKARPVNGGETIKIRLTGMGCVTFNKKYFGKQIYIAFPYDGHKTWYLYPHDELEKTLHEKINNKKYRDTGKYFQTKPSKYFLNALKGYTIEHTIAQLREGKTK